MNRPDRTLNSKTTWRFTPGNSYLTPGVLSHVNPLDICNCIQRHLNGDWGDCCSEDLAENERALMEGGRLLSVYHDICGVKFWILTEADRSATTVLLPDEY